MQGQVVQDVHLWTQASVAASSQPGEVEADSADDVTGENSSRAWRRGHVPLDRDGWRWFWEMTGKSQKDFPRLACITYCNMIIIDGASSSKTLYRSHISIHTG